MGAGTESSSLFLAHPSLQYAVLHLPFTDPSHQRALLFFLSHLLLSVSASRRPTRYLLWSIGHIENMVLSYHKSVRFWRRDLCSHPASESAVPVPFVRCQSNSCPSNLLDLDVFPALLHYPSNPSSCSSRKHVFCDNFFYSLNLLIIACNPKTFVLFQEIPALHVLLTSPDNISEVDEFCESCDTTTTPKTTTTTTRRRLTTDALAKDRHRTLADMDPSPSHLTRPRCAHQRPQENFRCVSSICTQCDEAFRKNTATSDVPFLKFRR